MLKRLLSFGMMLVLLASLIVPTSAVLAENENENAEAETTNEEVEETEANDEEATENEDAEGNAENDGAEDVNEKEAEANENAESGADSATNLIYYLVIGFVFVLSVGTYALTEGVRKD